MRAATEIFGRILGQRGFIQHVASIGAGNVDLIITPIDDDDLTGSQEKASNVCARDSVMQDLMAQVHARYEVLKLEHNLDAEPWYGDLQTPSV